jgi:dipeptidyl aminopeptidase/acylaminoacyl peptidase
MHQLFFSLLFFATSLGFSQSTLNLKEIMKGQDFTGYWPEAPQWSFDGSSLYFRWNKDGKEDAEAYQYLVKTQELKPISEVQWKTIIPFDPSQAPFSNQLSLVQESLVLTSRKTAKSLVLLQTDHYLSDLVRFSPTEATVRMDGDFYLVKFNEQGLQSMVQLTRYIAPKRKNAQDTSYLERQQMELFNYIKDQTSDAKVNEKSSFETVKEMHLPAEYQHISGRYLNYTSGVVLLREDVVAQEKPTEFTRFITKDGYTSTAKARAKVSEKEPSQLMHLHWLKDDTLIALDFSKLTDIRRKPSYMDTTGGSNFKEDRPIFIHDPVFAQTKSLALLDVRAADNKDRWIVLVDLTTGAITEIERQHDDAWMGGPGISEWNMENATLGFAPQDEVVYFQSEENGYSQVYELNLSSNRKELVYPGGSDFEMQSVSLNTDGTRYFVVHNANNSRSLQGSWLHRIHKKMVPVVSNQWGGFKELAISPNEKMVAYLASTANNPWELYLKIENQPVVKITESKSTAFSQYPWRIPEYVTYPASDGQQVYARLYRPLEEKSNGAAVLFVHGAGYLQNAHAWWSHYYREYMFHNLLVDYGYTVLDVDYRASAGYGRDYRTAIYRHMGGRDVRDFLDAKKYLKTLNVDTNRIGMYGGSYGGFVTLMSLFQHPDAFACGAALRAVTDWVHYNHEYTSNILNHPTTDPEAYKKSSPIYFAEGLSKPLLMLHGMVDENVQFQDIVRLQQRLIELGKTRWELATYPVEAHGFKESYSWYDEYRRILELFEEHLRKQ